MVPIADSRCPLSEISLARSDRLGEQLLHLLVLFFVVVLLIVPANEPFIELTVSRRERVPDVVVAIGLTLCDPLRIEPMNLAVASHHSDRRKLLSARLLHGLPDSTKLVLVEDVAGNWTEIARLDPDRRARLNLPPNASTNHLGPSLIGAQLTSCRLRVVVTELSSRAQRLRNHRTKE